MQYWWDAENANDIIDKLEEEIIDLSARLEELAKENETLRRALDRALAVLAYLERHHAMAA